MSLLSLGCGSLLEVVRVVEFGYDSVKFVEVSSKVSIGILLRNRLQIVIQLGYLNWNIRLWKLGCWNFKSVSVSVSEREKSVRVFDSCRIDEWRFFYWVFLCWKKLQFWFSWKELGLSGFLVLILLELPPPHPTPPSQFCYHNVISFVWIPLRSWWWLVENGLEILLWQFVLV